MKNIIKALLLTLILLSSSQASKINKKEYSKKSNQYYKQYKKEWDELPIENKKRIVEAYQMGKKYDMGYTLAATRFLENRGKSATFKDKDSINKNIHKGYVTYDCGAFGINTMTYLNEVGKKTKDKNTHLQACKKLADNKELNLKMAMKVYDYGLDKFDGDIVMAWNYYNTGRDDIINDRIYKVKAMVTLLQQEIKV